MQLDVQKMCAVHFKINFCCFAENFSSEVTHISQVMPTKAGSFAVTVTLLYYVKTTQANSRKSFMAVKDSNNEIFNGFQKFERANPDRGRSMKGGRGKW